MNEGAAVTDPVCITENVIVEGKQAVWIFSEFETDEALPQLVAWLTPDDWPKWGGGMFKEMKPVGPRTNVPTAAGEQWHANYLEVVSLAKQELHTVLACDFQKTTSWAAMTYDLDHSVGGRLQVDRGFLSAVDRGDSRQVKALKVVGFTDTVNNALATMVCPAWSQWIQKATTNAARLVAGGRLGPTNGAVGDGASAAPSGAADEEAAAFTEGYAKQWVDEVNDMAQFYGGYATDVGSRLWSGVYKQTDAAEDSTRLFLRLARDWSRAWQSGTDLAARLATADVSASGAVRVPGGARQKTTECTTVLAPAPAKPAPVSITDLTRMSIDASKIPAAALTVSPESVGPTPNPAAIQVTADTTNFPSGLYSGSLRIGTPGSQQESPALFYVSKARPGE